MTISSIPESLSLPCRDYRYDWFVGRQSELNSIREKINAGLNREPIKSPIIHLWGIPGIGKSWLLQHLEHEKWDSVSHDPVFNQKRSVLPIRVDFGNLDFTNEDSSIIQLLKCILECLCVPACTSIQEEVAQLSQKCLSSGIHITALMEDFVNCVKGAAECCLLFFLFDTIERVPSEAFSWLERELIAPLARTDRVIFVIVGRKELLRWKEFVVRQRLDIQKIRGLSRSETQRQLSNYKVPEDVVSEVYPYTFGHPYANSVWAGAWVEEGQPSPEKKCALLEQVESGLLEEIQGDRERDILRALSALRKFNVESARRLLGAIVGSEFATVSDGYYLHLFEVLEQSSLVYCDSNLRGYVFPPEVRFILQSVLKCRNSALYFEVHQEALRMYEQWLTAYQGREVHFLPEVLYHGVRLNLDGVKFQDRDLPDLLRTHLISNHFDAAQLDNLYRVVKDDQELETLLRPEMYEAILLQIEHARKERI